MKKRMSVVAVLLGALVLFGACSDENPTIPESEATATSAPEGGAVAVKTADSDLGKILVDGEGRTLYVFDNDEAGVSNCNDNCAVTWPALAAEGEPTAGGDAKESELDTIERADETEQVTYNDRPLYHYSGDTAAGDTKGQGIGDRWHVVGTDGEPIKDSSRGAGY